MDIAGDIFKALKSLCTILNEARIDYCLIGGLAVAILAKPRATEDIDFLILIEEQQRSAISELMKNKFEIVQDSSIFHFQKATIWRTILSLPSGETAGLVMVDFLMADNEIYREVVKNPIELIIDDVKIPVATPENLIRMKELSNRPQDLLDIEFLKESLKSRE